MVHARNLEIGLASEKENSTPSGVLHPQLIHDYGSSLAGCRLRNQQSRPSSAAPKAIFAA